MTRAAACFDPGLPLWLQAQKIALVLSTYRANRLLFIGTDEQAELQVQERLFDRPMGLFTAGNSLWMAGRCHLWRFDNVLEGGQRHEGGDRLYVPAASFLTGEVNVHELVLDGTGEPLFVNTLFSCLARLGVACSFQPLWQPPFIDAIAAEDRCHLNGVALQDGQPTWVTACSSGNSPTSWRLEREGGGVLLHLPSGEIAARGLTMPHSPRWHAGRLWLLNSGTGELGWIDQGVFQPLCWLPGFVRGLAFAGGCALVGLSKLRSPQFSGLPLEKRLQAAGLPEGICGLRVIDLNSGAVLHSLDLPAPIDELFDLVVLEGVRQPRALGLKDEEIDCLVKLPQQEHLVRIKPGKPSGSPYQGVAPPRLGLPQTTESRLVYQRVFQLTPDTLAPYAALTYPSLAPGSAALQALRGELLGVSAMADGVMVGLVLAERTGATAAAVVSLIVHAAWRGRGIGTRMLHHLMVFLAQEGVEALSIRYQAPCDQPAPLAPILSRLGWAPPQQQFLLLEGQAEQLGALPWPERFPLPADYRLVEWQAGYTAAAERLGASPELQAATRSPLQEPAVSLALLAREDLVGWLIVDRTGPASVRYSSLFVAPGHRSRGQALHLLVQGFRRQAAAGIPLLRAAVAPNSQAMLRLVQRHLRHQLSRITIACGSQIQFSRASGTEG
jgi:uncharacterized protein (TIGR03032 family)